MMKKKSKKAAKPAVKSAAVQTEPAAKPDVTSCPVCKGKGVIKEVDKLGKFRAMRKCTECNSKQDFTGEIVKREI